MEHDYTYLSTVIKGVKNILVSRDDKWGYINRAGKEVAMYDNAGHFTSGVAIVIKNGKGVFVDESFNTASKTFSSKDVYTIGSSSFVVTKADGTKYVMAASEYPQFILSVQIGGIYYSLFRIFIYFALLNQIPQRLNLKSQNSH